VNSNPIDPQVLSSLVSAGGAVLATVITIRLRAHKKKSPVDEAFDRLNRQIKEQQKTVDWLFDQLEQSQALIKTLQADISEVRRLNQSLETQLHDAQRRYGSNDL